MKKFILKVLIFLLPALLPLLVVELLIRHIPNDYKNKNDYMLSDKAKHIETLILGNSHTHLGVNPQYLDSKAFNLAFIGENLEFSFKVYEKYQTNLNNIKTIILPISYGSLYSKSLSKKWIKNYSIYYGLKTTDFPVDNLEILNKSISTIWENLKDYYVHKDAIIFVRSDSLGWRYRMEPNIKDYEKVAKKIVKRHTHKDVGQVQRNFNLLSKFVEECKLANINVILLTTPVHKEYINGMNKEQWETTINKSNLLAAKFNNVSYFNFYNDKRFVQEDFKDADHLNVKGAEKFTKYLNKIMNQIRVSND
ncbi:hypothetical protein [Winogradskyella endarachnes]|uniref:SGNH/GDSL hydrolase family protein n=1 Tax=Winogradskyella endarachnes TaxID=2681965 RepID=A0A6L6U6K4_9FLAO|nr:hypothetical protein [Winogradskyella endarachnes]MUU77870.1 hypothetical protein [Winogradskyella endarachnes]